MKLACADFTFPLLKHEQSLDLIRMLDFEGVDIGLFEGRSHLWPSREFGDAARSGRKLKAQLDDRGLKAADVFLQMDADFVPFAVNHPEPARREKARDWFSRTLEYARAAGAEHVTALPGVAFEGEPKEESLRRTREELAWRVDQARAAGLIFSVEAHVGSIAPTPREALALVESVPGLTLTLDYTHFTRAGLPDSEVEPLVPHASHFHARGARKGRLQCNFSENTIDYRRVAQLLRQAQYAGYIGVEYVWIDWEDCNKSDNLSETIQFRDLFRSMDGRQGDHER